MSGWQITDPLPFRKNSIDDELFDAVSEGVRMLVDDEVFHAIRLAVTFPVGIHLRETIKPHLAKEFR